MKLQYIGHFHSKIFNKNYSGFWIGGDDDSNSDGLGFNINKDKKKERFFGENLSDTIKTIKG